MRLGPTSSVAMFPFGALCLSKLPRLKRADEQVAKYVIFHAFLHPLMNVLVGTRTCSTSVPQLPWPPVCTIAGTV